MNLNELINLVMNNLDDLKIEYSCINGKESLKVNGKDICKEYDDSELIRKIESFKDLLNELDDCTFMDVMDYIKKEKIDVIEINNFMDQEHYTESDELKADNYINIISNAVHDVIVSKIENLKNILYQL